MPDPSGTKYCGVPVAEIVSSLQAAGALLRDNLPYPETRGALDRWLANDPFVNLESTQDACEVKRILAETGTKSLLRTYKSVFEYFALSGDAGRTGGEEGDRIRIYENLAAWGGFNYWNAINDPSFYNDALLAEKDAFLAARYGRLLPGDLSEAEATRLQLYLKREQEKLRPEAFQRGAANLKVFRNTLSAEGEKAAVELFLSWPAGDRLFVRGALYAPTGFGLQKHLLENLSPFRIFGLVAYEGNKAPGNRKDYAAVKEELKEYLAPRLQDDWVRAANATGGVTYDRSREGVIFHTVPAIARHVAARFSGYEVIDRLGTRVKPDKGSGSGYAPAP